MGTVLKVGVIFLPLIVFLAVFGSDIVTIFVHNAGDAASQAESLRDSAAGSSTID